eukprot:COSAG01_NODE_771_length_13718_cov_54.441442_10_plen_323_part_00
MMAAVDRPGRPGAAAAAGRGRRRQADDGSGGGGGGIRRALHAPLVTTGVAAKPPSVQVAAAPPAYRAPPGARLCDQLCCGEAVARWQGNRVDGHLPLYWILVISLYQVPLALMNVCINQILLPPLIKQTVGAKNKELALGQVTSLCAAIHAIEPFLGAISDRARCSFRKRAFILFGQSCTCLGVAGFWYVDHLPEVDTSASTGGEEVHSHGVKWHLLVLAYFCLHLGNMVGWIPYIAIIPEMAPSQRGQAAGIIGVVGGACAYCGSLLGGAIGENWITHDEAFVSSELQTLALPSVSAERLTWTELAKGHVSSCCSICAHLT